MRKSSLCGQHRPTAGQSHTPHPAPCTRGCPPSLNCSAQHRSMTVHPFKSCKAQATLPCCSPSIVNESRHQKSMVRAIQPPAKDLGTQNQQSHCDIGQGEIRFLHLRLEHKCWGVNRVYGNGKGIGVARGKGRGPLQTLWTCSDSASLKSNVCRH